MKASASHDAREQNGFVAWLEEQLPVREFIQSQLTDYYAPKNLNVWYYFGVLALVVLASRYATGIVLAMFAFFWLMPVYSKVEAVTGVLARVR